MRRGTRTREASYARINTPLPLRGRPRKHVQLRPPAATAAARAGRSGARARRLRAGARARRLGAGAYISNRYSVYVRLVYVMVYYIILNNVYM